MTTIAVIGANGQVGTETCLTLLGLPHVKVIAICRSRLSSALLERCGVPCRIGSMMELDDARRLLAGADAIFDLSLPGGSEPEARKTNVRVIENAIAGSPPGARYVFASTYMALGIGTPGEPLGHRRIARTAYGARKRIMEHATFQAAAEHDRKAFVLRLGQVHGVIQGVSRQVRSLISDDPTEVPAGPSNTVFISTIAEGLIGIATGRETPGTYMMVSHPQWSWKELHAYFAEQASVHPGIIEIPLASPRKGILARLKACGIAQIAGQRELLAAYVLPRLPEVERKSRAWHHLRSARAQLAAASVLVRRPYDGAYVGNAPGARLLTPTDSRFTVHSHLARVRELLSDLLT